MWTAATAMRTAGTTASRTATGVRRRALAGPHGGASATIFSQAMDILKSTSQALGLTAKDKVATEEYGAKLNRSELKWLEKRCKIKLKQPCVLPKRITDQLPEILKGRSLPQLASYYEKLHARRLDRLRLFKDGQDAVKPILYSWKESLAYLSFDLAPSYGLSKRIIEDSLARADWNLVQTTSDDPDRKNEPVMRSMLDFGSGVGSSVLAARDTDALRTTLDEATLVEPSRSMWEIAQTLVEPPPDLQRPIEDLLSDYKRHGQFRADNEDGEDGDAAESKKRPNISLLWSPSISEMVQGLSAEDFPQYDLVTAIFSLSELPSDQARAVALGYLWKLVKPGGVLIIAERADRASRNIVLDARELLVEQKTLSRALTRVLAMNPFRGGHPRVIAPCTHSLTCPMASGNLPPGRFDRGCQFTQSIMRTVTKRSTKGQGTGRRSSSFAYSYFAAQKIPLSPAEKEEESRRWSSFADEDDDNLNEDIVDAEKRPSDADATASHDAEKRPASRADETQMEAQHDVSEVKTDEADKAEATTSADEPELDPVSEIRPARILRHPLVRKGHITMDLCQSDGTIDRVTFSKSKLRDRVYRAARKASWGGLWMDISRPQHFGSEKDTGDDNDDDPDEDDEPRHARTKRKKTSHGQHRRTRT